MKKLLQVFIIGFLLGVMSMTSFASDQYVYDEAGLLTVEEAAELDERADAVSEKYGLGVYMIAVGDYKDYSTSDVYMTTTEMYHGLGLGKGEAKEGMVLLLSMQERDYATFFFGEHVEYAFDEYGQSQMEKEFLDNFGNDDWYGGFSDYISVCDEYLGLAASGNPVREDYSFFFVIVVVSSLLIAFVAVTLLKSSMKSVHKGTVANEYVTANGLNLAKKSDVFLYNTQTRRTVESSSKSKSQSGGGGSGRSGKF